MPRNTIDIAQLKVQPHHLFQTQWALVTAGDFDAGQYNTMTIGWGALGTMWSKPFAFVAVRHSRFTFKFMEKYNTFTLSTFPSQFHRALELLGTRSGLDGDKIADSGLTPEAAQVVAAPTFAEAELVIECQKIYANDLDPDKIPADVIQKYYRKEAIHRIYYGEIVSVSAIETYYR
jgi:flavin reductase (DIM6/NTAB) family NADH-FMN oxidoreductase RutF